MTALTLSKSGTAWFNDMRASGITSNAGWASSPNAAYYASLDTDNPLPNPGPKLPTSMTELLKLHNAATDAKDTDAADQIQQQIKSEADKNALPSSGNIINVEA